MKFLKKKIKAISMDQATKEIDNIISGKDNSIGGKIVRNWYKARKLSHPNEPVRENLIMEKYTKHNQLANKEITIEALGKSVETEMEVVTNGEESKEKSSKKS